MDLTTWPSNDNTLYATVYLPDDNGGKVSVSRLLLLRSTMADFSVTDLPLLFVTIIVE